MKRKKTKDEEEGSSNKARKTSRRASTPDNLRPRGLFPDHCMICKKKSLKVNNKRQPLTCIVTKTAESTLKAAAQARNDQEMTAAVAETDLIAREFQKHEKCYREYTRVVRDQSEAAEVNTDDSESYGNLDAVLCMIDNDVLHGQQCLSMETLMNEYRGDPGTKQSRHKLKERIQKHYQDKLLFLQPPGIPHSAGCNKQRVPDRTDLFKEFDGLQRIHSRKICTSFTREYI